MATVRVIINANGVANPKKREANPGDDVEFRVASRSVVLCFEEGVFPETRYEVCNNTTLTIPVTGSIGDYPYSITICGEDGDCADCPQTNPACDDPTPDDEPPEMIII